MKPIYQAQLKADYCNWFDTSDSEYQEILYLPYEEWAILRKYYLDEINRVGDAIPQIASWWGMDIKTLNIMRLIDVRRYYYQMILEKYGYYNKSDWRSHRS